MMLLLVLVLGGVVSWSVKLSRTGAGTRRRMGVFLLVLLGALLAAFPFFIDYANSTEPEPIPAYPDSN